jgi:hypothetical protein
MQRKHWQRPPYLTFKMKNTVEEIVAECGQCPMDMR